MGLYEGGLLLTVVYISVLSLMVVTGILAPNVQTQELIKCNPNQGTIGNYGGLDTNQTNFNDCFTDSNTGSLNISTDSTGKSNILATLGSIIGGPKPAQSIEGIFYYLSLMPFGWLMIFQAIFGIAGPLSFLIYIIGLPLQIFQLYFLFEIMIRILAAFASILGRLF